VKVRFQTDADFDRRIVRATLRREPAIDLQLALRLAAVLACEVSLIRKCWQ